jgi:uncharacterized protein YbcC (UPF0753/DUF2309 family)
MRQFLPALLPGRILTYENPLRAFQEQNFFDALRHASNMLGYRTSLSLEEYRSLYNSKKVKPDVLERVLVEKKGAANTFEWQDKILMKKFPPGPPPRIGKLRANWQKQYKTDPDARVHPRLFRILGSYLDHGVSDWKFPVRGQGFLDSMREIESSSFVSAFNTPRARNLLLHTSPSISDLLTVIVGDETLFKQYLFDQQFAHRGWSGLVATLEASQKILPSAGHITLHDLIMYELLLEIDVLDDRLGEHWKPLASLLTDRPGDLFMPDPVTEKSEVLAIWQQALEWSYYDGILADLHPYPQNSSNQTGGHIPETTVANAADCLCIIGRPALARNIAAGQCAFRHGYDFSLDRDGVVLEKILETAVPSLGAANLEYFFSRTGLAETDADSTLADRTIGLFGVADSNRSDLRIGLPAELIRTSEPKRLLCVVEHFPEVVLKVIDRLNSAHWLVNEWVHLVVTDPVTSQLRVLKNGKMVAYKSHRRFAGCWPVQEAVH